MPKNKVYAVAVGRNVGIYDRWDECEKQVML
jgi:viroplasmin and RNaseH domain-containing protein